MKNAFREKIKANRSSYDDSVSFVVYSGIEVRIPKEDWDFLCKYRWFSEEPFRDEVEAELGLYGARSEKTSEGASACARECVADLRSAMGSDIKEECDRLADSNCSTFLTVDENGNLVVKG